MSKKSIIIISVIAVVLIGIGVCSNLPECSICGSKSNVSERYGHDYCDDCYESAINKSDYSTNNYSNNYSYSSFTNKYGTATTKCAHSGCTNYIAKSGDTNCCTTHSNRCYECGCYIDEDANWCMSCIENALK